MLLAFGLLSLAPILGQTPPQLVVFFYGLPFLVGLLVFRTPINAFLRKRGLWDGFRCALPTALIGLLIAYPAHFWMVKRQVVP
jgi:hypothetical protein